ncbi:hypothetical protein [Weissella cibaria]|uniref:hypothetical protein n=1 Tax=Weissella cibaria TaxID=137591 RepID=UPI003D3680F9
MPYTTKIQSFYPIINGSSVTKINIPADSKTFSAEFRLELFKMIPDVDYSINAVVTHPIVDEPILSSTTNESSEFPVATMNTVLSMSSQQDLTPYQIWAGTYKGIATITINNIPISRDYDEFRISIYVQQEGTEQNSIISDLKYVYLAVEKVPVEKEK